MSKSLLSLAPLAAAAAVVEVPVVVVLVRVVAQAARAVVAMPAPKVPLALQRVLSSPTLPVFLMCQSFLALLIAIPLERVVALVLVVLAGTLQPLGSVEQPAAPEGQAVEAALLLLR